MKEEFTGNDLIGNDARCILAAKFIFGLCTFGTACLIAYGIDSKQKGELIVAEALGPALLAVFLVHVFAKCKQKKSSGNQTNLTPVGNHEAFKIGISCTVKGDDVESHRGFNVATHTCPF